MSNSADAIVNRNYSLEIGNYFGRGLSLFKQFALPFIGFILLIALIQVIISILPAPLGSAGGEGSRSPGILGLAFNIISPVLNAGLYIVAFKLAKGQSPTFNDFFRGFNNFLQLFLIGVVGGLLTAIGTIFLIIPGIYLAVAYLFGMPLVIEKRFDFWTALETSRKLITKRWFSFFGFVISLILLNIAGALLLGIGLLVTVPLSSCIIVAAYEDVVGLNGTHLGVADSEQF